MRVNERRIGRVGESRGEGAGWGKGEERSRGFSLLGSSRWGCVVGWSVQGRGWHASGWDAAGAVKRERCVGRARTARRVGVRAGEPRERDAQPVAFRSVDRALSRVQLVVRHDGDRPLTTINHVRATVQCSFCCLCVYSIAGLVSTVFPSPFSALCNDLT